ncbi:MAG: hypothetical protein EBR09_05595 [Proteobacteria bacterium]|nr:hypothetical protein [Pseudomonadota bacterium]
MVKFVAGLVSVLAAVGCSTDLVTPDSSVASQATQRWTFNPSSGAVSSFAESAAQCAGNFPSTSLSSGYCFNPVPVAEISAVTDVGQIISICVATHDQGSAATAALVVVDQNGEFVSEAFGKGRMQVLATLAGSGKFKVYAGFSSAGEGQRVKVLAGFSSQFSIASVAACNLR